MSLGSHVFQTCTSICTCSLIVVNSLFVLYLMCCFSNNPLYMDFRPIQILFCSVLTHPLYLLSGISISFNQEFLCLCSLGENNKTFCNEMLYLSKIYEFMMLCL